jgi:ATPase subunit of ABC transporter with duplicated ATPase domains
MTSRMMQVNPNMLILDEPTNHLDLESIIAYNDALKDYTGVILLTSHDHELMETVANRIIELTPNGIIDKKMTYDEYLVNDQVKAEREKLYGKLVK